MLSASSIFTFVVALVMGPSVFAFAPTRGSFNNYLQVQHAKNNDRGDTEQWTTTSNESIPSPLGISFPNPLTEIADMFSSLDDVIDDFFNKRVSA